MVDPARGVAPVVHRAGAVARYNGGLPRSAGGAAAP